MFLSWLPPTIYFNFQKTAVTTAKLCPSKTIFEVRKMEVWSVFLVNIILFPFTSFSFLVSGDYFPLNPLVQCCAEWQCLNCKDCSYILVSLSKVGSTVLVRGVDLHNWCFCICTYTEILSSQDCCLIWGHVSFKGSL